MLAWREGNLDFSRVAINLPPSAFSQSRFADAILGILDLMRIPAECLEIEVPETVLLGDRAENVSSALKRLHHGGAGIALDDFGTGYASLTHLKQFPVDHVKIDRSFIRNLERDAADRVIVAAIIALARNLRIEVTAEGVETAGWLRLLRELGCGTAQGYIFGNPMPASEVPSFPWPRG